MSPILYICMICMHICVCIRAHIPCGKSLCFGRILQHGQVQYPNQRSCNFLVKVKRVTHQSKLIMTNRSAAKMPLTRNPLLLMCERMSIPVKIKALMHKWSFPLVMNRIAIIIILSRKLQYDFCVICCPALFSFYIS